MLVRRWGACWWSTCQPEMPASSGSLPVPRTAIPDGGDFSGECGDLNSLWKSTFWQVMGDFLLSGLKWGHCPMTAALNAGLRCSLLRHPQRCRSESTRPKPSAAADILGGLCPASWHCCPDHESRHRVPVLKQSPPAPGTCPFRVLIEFSLTRHIANAP